MKKILMFFYLLRLLIKGNISLWKIFDHDYSTDKSIRVLMPYKNGLYKEERLYFNINLIPIENLTYKIVGTQSRLVNKELFWPVDGEIYAYDLSDDTFELILSDD